MSKERNNELHECRLNIEKDTMYCLSTKFDESLETIVFIHGLGESSVCFADAFDWLPQYNLIMFDMCGYGYSPASEGSHSTEAQAKRVIKALELLEINQCFLIGHSWGGDIATIICDLTKDRLVKGFINAEGGLHEDNMILSEKITEKLEKLCPDGIDSWVKGNGFAQLFSLHWGHGAGIKYLTSVRRCCSKVLKATANEIYLQLNGIDERGVTEWGRVYENIRIPKSYFWGTGSLKGSVRALKVITGLKNVSFEDANHWVQNDPVKFYSEVEKFIIGINNGVKT